MIIYQWFKICFFYRIIGDQMSLPKMNYLLVDHCFKGNSGWIRTQDMLMILRGILNFKRLSWRSHVLSGIVTTTIDGPVTLNTTLRFMIMQLIKATPINYTLRLPKTRKDSQHSLKARPSKIPSGTKRSKNPLPLPVHSIMTNLTRQ